MNFLFISPFLAIKITFVVGKREPKNTPELPNVANGQAHNVRATPAGRGARGGEDDADHLCLSPHPAADGRVRLSEGLHSA